jgi:hypothetical protein
LQPTFALVGHFLLNKINFFKFSNCKWHLIVGMLTKEKILSIFICDPIILNICQARKPTMGNIDSCFYHHYRRHLISLGSSWDLLEIKSSLLINFMTSSLVLVVI